MKRLALIVVLLALPASAEARLPQGVNVAGSQPKTVIVAPPDAAYPYQRWTDQAKVPTPDVTLTVLEEPCPVIGDGAMACIGHTTIWMGASLANAEQKGENFFHEVGHYYLWSHGLPNTETNATLYAFCARFARWPDNLDPDGASTPPITGASYRRWCAAL